MEVQILFKTGSIIPLPSQLEEYRLDVTSLQETKVQGEGPNGHEITQTHLQ